MYENSIHGLLVAQPFRDKNEFDSSDFSKRNGNLKGLTLKRKARRDTSVEHNIKV